MKLLKTLALVAVAYATFVVLFETVYLGLLQPSFEDAGIPMLTLTTTDADGAHTRRLASFNLDGQLYVSAHHWPRGWYRRARQNPSVRVAVNGVTARYIASPVSGAEFERVAAAYPLPLPVRFLMGFPPPRKILRLDRPTRAEGSVVPFGVGLSPQALTRLRMRWQRVGLGDGSRAEPRSLSTQFCNCAHR